MALRTHGANMKGQYDVDKSNAMFRQRYLELYPRPLEELKKTLRLLGLEDNVYEYSNS